MTPEAQARAIIEQWKADHVLMPDAAPKNLSWWVVREPELLAELAAALAQGYKDYEEVLADHRRLVRKLDGLMNGDGAAPQASLCDIVCQFPQWKAQARREVWEEVANQCDPNGLGPDNRSWHALNGWAFIRDWCRAQAQQEEGP